ncbi:MAG: dihydropteroate synthase [bacterium]
MNKRKRYTLQLHDRNLDLGMKSCIMGILNLTADSFYDGGRFHSLPAAVQRAHQMVAEGADIIDIGAESTRPGSTSISPEEEIRQLTPIVKCLREEIPVPLSIDTYKARVAEVMLDLGVHLINDISGLHFDPHMAGIIAQYKSPVVLMHIQGTPKDMQKNPHYHNLIQEIKDYLQHGIDQGLQAGIPEHQIIIDPGIGFGKTVAHNLEIIQRLSEFQTMDKPILLGPSRKSFIGKVLDLPVTERLEGTAAATVVGLVNGAHIIRVHDVEAMVRVARMTDAILNPQAYH